MSKEGEMESENLCVERKLKKRGWEIERDFVL
jgi:hypothetical protein